MPVVLAIFGAVATGLVYWLLWGRGMEYVEWKLGDWQRRRRDAARHRRATEQRAMAPLRAISDPRDAAVTLMILVASLRGEPTPEQIGTVEGEMERVLGLGTETAGRLAYASFAAQQALSPERAVEDLAPLLRTSLTAAERDDLVAMLRNVAAVHAGPLERQEALIGFLTRRLAAQP